MLKMEIAIDDKKIVNDNRYNPSDVHNELERTLQFYHLKKESDGVYVGNGTQHDFAFFGKAILDLKKQDWFLPYVSKWLFYSGNSVEDVAEHYLRKSGLKAGA